MLRAKVKRPTRPKFKPTVPETVEMETTFADGSVVALIRDENPEYEDELRQHWAELSRYKRAYALWRVASGKAGRLKKPWDKEEIGVGIERCPERFGHWAAENLPPWEHERRMRVRQREAKAS